MNFPILSTIIFLPFLGALFIFLSSQKSEKNDPPNGRFGELFWPYVRHVGAHMEDQVAKKSIQKAFKTSFAHILKTSKSFELLKVFGGPGCQVELKMAALRGSGEQLEAH